jgi:hypothetical protein
MRALLLFIAVSALAPLLAAQEQPAAARLDPLPQLLAATRAFAQSHKIDIGGIRGTRSGANEIGDSSTLLITLQNKHQSEQYLVTLEVAALSEQDRAHPQSDTNVYLTTGNHFVYHFVPVALQIATYGPFRAQNDSASANVAPKSARVVVSAEQLALGFDNCCRAFLRILEYKESRKDTSGFGIGFRLYPYPADVIEKSKRESEQVQLTSVEERGLAGSMPAIMSFFSLAQNTPGLRDILKEVIDYPSAWSVIKHGGRVDTNIGFEGAGVRNVSDETRPIPSYFLPFELSLNDQKALDVGIVVTTAQPPLLTTAGIERIYARSPSNHERMAFLEVIGAQLAPTTVASAKKR